MTPLRIGIAGPGAIGQTHADAIRAIPGLQLAAVAGGTHAQRARCAVSGFQTVQEMLAATALDAVAICTPSGAHLAPALASLQAGRHVLVEKPLCTDPAEAALLVRTAAALNLVCATVSQRRLEPQHALLKSLLDTGLLGQTRLIEASVHWFRPDSYYAEKPWRTDPSQGGGSLFNQGIHSLDLMLFLLGPVTRVQAMTGTLGHTLPVEDTCLATLLFAQGAMGLLATSTALPPGRPATLRLFTGLGSCELENDRITRWEFPGVPQPLDGGGTGDGASDPMAIGLAGHIAQWQDFAAAIRHGTPPSSTGQDGFEAVRTVAAIYRSAEQHRAVGPAEFPLDAEPP